MPPKYATTPASASSAGTTMSLEDFKDAVKTPAKTPAAPTSLNWADQDSDDDFELPSESSSFITATYGTDHPATAGIRRNPQQTEFNPKGPYIAELSNVPIDVSATEIYSFLKSDYFIGSKTLEFPSASGTSKKVIIHFREAHALRDALAKDCTKIKANTIFIDASTREPRSSMHGFAGRGNSMGGGEHDNAYENEAIHSAWKRSSATTMAPLPFASNQSPYLRYHNQNFQQNQFLNASQHSRNNVEPPSTFRRGAGLSSDVATPAQPQRAPQFTPLTVPVQHPSVPKVNPFGDAAPKDIQGHELALDAARRKQQAERQRIHDQQASDAASALAPATKQDVPLVRGARFSNEAPTAAATPALNSQSASVTTNTASRYASRSQQSREFQSLNTQIVRGSKAQPDNNTWGSSAPRYAHPSSHAKKPVAKEFKDKASFEGDETMPHMTPAESSTPTASKPTQSKKSGPSLDTNTYASLGECKE